LLGGRPQRAGARPFRGWAVANPSGPILWSLVPYIGSRRLSLLPAPVRLRVTCARISSNRAAVCACIRRSKGVAPRGARSSSCPGYLWRSALSRLLFSSISSVRPGVAPPALALPSSSRPLLRSGRGLGLCRLFSLLAAGLAAPCLCGGWCSAVPPRAASSCGVLAPLGAACRFLRAVTLSTVSVTLRPFARHWPAYTRAAHPYGRLGWVLCFGWVLCVF
jgi:hypothetical protein